MPKSRDAFRTISEVAEWLDTPAHVLRFWESKFSQVKPVKRAGGRRYYRPADMELLGGIKRLLHDDGMTIKGVQKVLREQGVRHVAALASQPVDEDEAIDDGTLIEDAPYAEVPLDEATDSVVAFPGEHLQQQASGMAPSEAEPQEAPESPLDEQDSMPDVAHDVADEPAQQEADEIQTAATDTPPAEDTTDEDTEAAAAAPMEPGDSPIETTDAEDATVEEVAPATDEIEDATVAPQASEETPDTLTATSTDTAPTLDLWGDNDTPELPFDLAPPSWKPPLPDDLVAALHPDTAEVLESLDPEPADTSPAEAAVAPAGLDLPDFGADSEAQPVPSAPAPAIGPLGQLARIRSLTPDQKAALAAQLPVLKALHDRLSAPLS
ncbi:MerR family transcriptional regulator [Mameliella alba]|uniref:MerR family transcriptional regulator n=1 Tax=Mameliella alba TaxID=561184 RepID=UPI000B52D5B2|nr:MerR family transcriptional regulator [Mameliella alba]MBY6119183.1 MerR family transcriptional regulator [Mameliella alba]OWV45159.1 MerR family transcriptional regulator [Mameliella alba]OWV66810.1 MerR family transcriptional regulator [Mameliella alba]